jgi:hypothetical protein
MVARAASACDGLGAEQGFLEQKTGPPPGADGSLELAATSQCPASRGDSALKAFL